MCVYTIYANHCRLLFYRGCCSLIIKVPLVIFGKRPSESVANIKCPTPFTTHTMRIAHCGLVWTVEESAPTSHQLWTMPCAAWMLPRSLIGQVVTTGRTTDYTGVKLWTGSSTTPVIGLNFITPQFMEPKCWFQTNPMIPDKCLRLRFSRWHLITLCGTTTRFPN